MRTLESLASECPFYSPQFDQLIGRSEGRVLVMDFYQTQ